ncbi:histone deacetylase family protein [Cucumibacter marinus]|uniref:histone deacetylase family protein n=1 Tax=Cucumibacter marinus TaxID=1121252 RepID=UPI000685FF68|nr:histone deacetylase family protein [Cucumibacter marinus]
MTTLLYVQPNSDDHVTPPGHPERPDRLKRLKTLFDSDRFEGIERHEVEPADYALAETVHSAHFIEQVLSTRPAEGIAQLDPDTYISPKSLEVASTALGAALSALDSVMQGEANNAFCAMRPPGHHAERDKPMGFCLVNTIAVAAHMAREKHGAERVAIVDFDVHHGNGTQNIFETVPDVFYASSHQAPLYPGTGDASETGVGNIVNVPLAAHSDGSAMREAYNDRILPALNAFSPDVLLVSAGFDADTRDPLAQLDWGPQDFAWVTGKLMDIAERRCSNRLVSLLEGGYDLEGLADGVEAHLNMLFKGTTTG